MYNKFQIDNIIFSLVSLIIFVSAIYFTILSLKIKKEKKVSNINQESTESSPITEMDEILYKQLLSNDYSLKSGISNFHANLLVAALQQIKNNPCYNPNDLDFNVDHRISELLEYADNEMRKSSNGTFVVVDIETTGLSTQTDRIIQISAVKVINFKIVDTYVSYVNPKKRISAAASDVHEITNDMLDNEPVFKDVYPIFEQFIENYTLVMHNSDFDYKFIQNECSRLNIVFKRKTVCTMKLWKNKYFELQKEQTSSAKLRDIVCTLLPKEQVNEYLANQHDALADAIATARIYLKMI